MLHTRRTTVTFGKNTTSFDKRSTHRDEPDIAELPSETEYITNSSALSELGLRKARHKGSFLIGRGIGIAVVTVVMALALGAGATWLFASIRDDYGSHTAYVPVNPTDYPDGVPMEKDMLREPCDDPSDDETCLGGTYKLVPVPREYETVEQVGTYNDGGTVFKNALRMAVGIACAILALMALYKAYWRSRSVLLDKRTEATVLGDDVKVFPHTDDRWTYLCAALLVEDARAYPTDDTAERLNDVWPTTMTALRSHSALGKRLDPHVSGYLLASEGCMQALGTDLPRQNELRKAVEARAHAAARAMIPLLIAALRDEAQDDERHELVQAVADELNADAKALTDTFQAELDNQTVDRLLADISSR